MSKIIDALYGILKENPKAIFKISTEFLNKSKKRKKVMIYDDLALNVATLRNVIESYYKCGSNEITYFEPMIRYLNENYRYDTKEMTSKIQDIMHQLNNDSERILFLRLLYESNCFNSEIMKKYVLIATQNSCDNILRFWMIQDMAEMVFRYPEYMYDEYYVDRKLAIEMFGKKTHLKISSTKSTNKKLAPKKYAIIVNGLTSTSNAASYLVYKYANEIARQGKEVAIFPNDCLNYKKGDCIVKPIKAAVSCSSIMYKEHKKILYQNVKVIYTRGTKIYDNIKDCLKNINRYKPDIVIDASGQCSFFTIFLKNQYPIIHLTFNGYMCGAHFDKYITKNKNITLELNKKYKAMDEEQIEDVPIGWEYRESHSTYSREMYGLEKDDFVYITVGNRLDIELKKDLIDIVVNHLRTSKKSKWIIVGPVDINLFDKYKDLIDNQKIILIRYEKELTALYRICNAYIEPDRTGGGTSVFLAMYQGMPIVISDFWADVLPTVGWHNAISGGYKNFDAFMYKLENNKNFYEDLSKKMMERARYFDVPRYISCLINIADRMV